MLVLCMVTFFKIELYFGEVVFDSWLDTRRLVELSIKEGHPVIIVSIQYVCSRCYYFCFSTPYVFKK